MNTTMPAPEQDWSVVVASNDSTILEANLLQSPDLIGTEELHVMKGFPSAALALNAGIERSAGRIVVCVHQDVYLPSGWFARLVSEINEIERQDADWGVVGVYGNDAGGQPYGHLYCVGNNKVMGAPFGGGKSVCTLDEVVLVVRKASGLRFDVKVPGFHLYGSDIALRGNTLGHKAYAVAAFCIHNTSNYKYLPMSFWKAYLHMRKVWWNELPVLTPCIRIERSLLPLFEDFVRRWWANVRHRNTLRDRVQDPVKLWRELQRVNLG